MAGQELREKAQALKEEAWQLARQSLEQGDKQLYKEMIEITERLTELTNRQEHMTGANNVHADKQGLLPIFKRYKGVRYDAHLDRSKINGGRGECVLFRGRWQTVPAQQLPLRTTKSMGGGIFGSTSGPMARLLP